MEGQWRRLHGLAFGPTWPHAAAHGLGFRALHSTTIDAARILGVDRRLGSIEVGKDGGLTPYFR